MREQLEEQIRAIRDLTEQMEEQAESLKEAWTEYTYYPEDMLADLDQDVQGQMRYAELLDRAVERIAIRLLSFDDNETDSGKREWVFQSILMPLWGLAHPDHHQTDVFLPRTLTDEQAVIVDEIVDKALTFDDDPA